MAKKLIFTLASFPLTRWVDLLVTLVAAECGRARALGVVAPVDFGVGVTKLDGNVADQLVLETNGLYARDGLDNGRFAVSDVTDRSNVDGGLPGDDLWRQRVQFADVEILGVCLRWQLRSLDRRRGHYCLLQGRLERLLINLAIGVVLGVQAGRVGTRVRLGLDIVAKLVAAGHYDGGVINLCLLVVVVSSNVTV